MILKLWMQIFGNDPKTDNDELLSVDHENQGYKNLFEISQCKISNSKNLRLQLHPC